MSQQKVPLLADNQSSSSDNDNDNNNNSAAGSYSAVMFFNADGSSASSSDGGLSSDENEDIQLMLDLPPSLKKKVHPHKNFFVDTFVCFHAYDTVLK